MPRTYCATNFAASSQMSRSRWAQPPTPINQPSGGSDLWSKIFANAPLILGSILIAFVLLVPKGLVPTLSDIVFSVFRRRQRQEQRGLEPQQAE